MPICQLCRKHETTGYYKCSGCNGDVCPKCTKDFMPQGHKKCYYCTTYEDRKNYNTPHVSKTNFETN